MKAAHVFAGLPVADYGAARAWYEAFFGRPPDLLPHDNEAAWQLSGEGWVYVVGDRERAGGGLLTLLVDDLDARLESLAAEGIATGPIKTLPGGVRTVDVADPDGNQIQLGQVP